MSRWTIYVEGEREVRSSLRLAGQKATELTKVHRKVAREARKDLRAASPALTGTMRRSGRQRATQRVAEVSFSTPYVIKQEFRPHGPKSRRGGGWYFGPTASREHSDWEETYWREFTAMLDRAFGS